MFQVNQLSESLLGTRLLPYRHTPTQHNNSEFFEVEYLYGQAAGGSLSPPQQMMDEGFVNESMRAPSIPEHVLMVGVGKRRKKKRDQEVCMCNAHANDHYMKLQCPTTNDYRGISGWIRLGNWPRNLWG